MIEGQTLHLDPILLHLIDLVVNCLQLIVIGGTEILSICFLRDFGQNLLVDLDLHRHETGLPPRIDCRIGSRTFTSHADRVDPDSKCFGNIRRRQWSDLAAVVHPIGQQDDHFAFGLTLPQPVD